MSRRYFILGTSSAYGNKVGKKDCEHHFSSIETKSPIGSSMDFAPQRILKILEILLWPLLGLLLVASRLAIANPVGKSKQIFFLIYVLQSVQWYCLNTYYDGRYYSVVESFYVCINGCYVYL